MRLGGNGKLQISERSKDHKTISNQLLDDLIKIFIIYIIFFIIMLVLVLSILVLATVRANQCPQLCQTCTANQCDKCYSNFFSDSSYTLSQPSCKCPQGYFLNQNINLCNFCPIQCSQCINANICTRCEKDYKLINGKCIKPTKDTNHIQFANDLTPKTFQTYLLPGFWIQGQTPTSTKSNYFQGSCSLQQNVLGGLYYDYNTVILKTYYGLPFHQYAYVKAQFVVIDQWLDDKFIVQLQVDDNPDWRTFTTINGELKKQYSFDQNQRKYNFCGQHQYSDNLGLYNYSFPHQKSMLKIRFRTSLAFATTLPNNYDKVLFGLSQIVLIVGTCPKGCLRCNSYLCSDCSDLYSITSSYECICNINVAILTNEGDCIAKCLVNQIYHNQLHKCVACAEIISGCQACDSTGCTQCSIGRFLYSNICVKSCPAQYQQILDIVYKCQPCPTGCISCQHDICQRCAEDYLLFEGICYHLSCPAKTFSDLSESYCIKCPEYCNDCTSQRNCLECTDTLTAKFSLINGQCKVLCAGTDQVMPVGGCDQMVCSANCQICFGLNADQCSTCSTAYVLQEFSCLNQCSQGYYEVLGVCLRCPDNCASCTRTTCTSCSDGYWLFESFCIEKCPIQYFQSLNNKNCQECGDNCKVCYNENICQICHFGWSLLDGVCEQTITCPASTYYNIQLATCLPCPQNCLTCFMDLCETCVSGTYIDNGKCVETCSRVKYLKNQICEWKDPLCAQYDINGECISCIYLNPPLILTNQGCLFACPQGFTKTFNADNSQEVCILQCPNNCRYCHENLTCYECQTDYVALEGLSPTCQIQCQDGQRSDSVQCVQCQFGCKQCQDNGKCSECFSIYNGRTLVLNSEYQCVEQNCLSSFKDSSGVCQVCSLPCATCMLSHQCTSCTQGSYLYQKYCTTICPASYFEDIGSLKCRPCPPSCEQCQSFNHCTVCKLGLYFFENKCIPECPSGYYIYEGNFQQTGIDICKKCHDMCQTCYGSSQFQCLSCYNGDALDQSHCVSHCPSGKYIDAFGHCDSCSYLCQQCYGPGSFQCINCHHETHLYYGKCYDNCPISTYLSQTSPLQCIECPLGCSTCTSTHCTACIGNYYLFNDTCRNLCPRQSYYSTVLKQCLNCGQGNCLECNNAGCTKCNYPYFVHNKECTIRCPIGTYEAYHILRQCLNCPSHCLQCTSPNSCNKCKNINKLQNGMCFPTCQVQYYYNATNQVCERCSNPWCEVCTEFHQCSGCQDNYILHESQCIISCPLGYYASTLTKRCQLCHPTCRSCYLYPTDCTSCLLPLVLYGKQCINQDHIDNPEQCGDHCSICVDTTSCKVCAIPYYLSPSFTCGIDCPIGSYQHLRNCLLCHMACEKCSGSHDNCQQCKAGYSLYRNKCVAICPSGFFADSRLANFFTPPKLLTYCSSCSANCVICQNKSQCFYCNAENYLISGFCETTCPPYFYGYSKQCLQCEQNCVRCFNSETCIQCSSNTYLYNGSCYDSINTQCPNGNYLTQVNVCTKCSFPCVSCIDSTTCQSCVVGYSLFGNRCVSICPKSYYSRNTSNIFICQPCSLSCSTCITNSTICTSCHTGFYLSGQDCIKKCPLSSYGDTIARICRKCSDFCTICQNNELCLYCHPAMYLLDGVCIQSCPEGYSSSFISAQVEISNKILSTCIKCSLPCETCSQNSVYHCLSCVSNHFLYGDRCVQSCPSGFYADISSKICRGCSPLCVTCTYFFECTSCLHGADPNTGECLSNNVCSGTSCDCSSQCEFCFQGTCYKCYDEYYLQQGDCVEQCKSGFYPNELTGNCLPYPVEEHCDIGISSQKCQICESPHIQYNKNCYQQCPQLTILIDDITPPKCEINLCLSNDSAGNCASCVSPYYLLDYKCVASCPSKYYMTDSSCQLCPNSCSICSTYKNCITCQNLFIFHLGQCLSECPVGYFNNQANQTCVKCKLGCISCISANICTECSYGTYLLNDQCLQQCPHAYYESVTNKSCEYCLDSNCVQCSNSTHCEICNTNFFTSNGQCISQCNIGSYEVSTQLSINNSQIIFGICYKCDQKCHNCTGNECISCNPGYYLLESGQCTIGCPLGTYSSYNSVTNYCQSCASPCADCYDTANYCIMCISNYLLLNHQCYQICPRGYYPFSNTCKACSPQCFACQTNSDTCTECYSGSILSSGQCISQCSLITQYYDTKDLICKDCSTQCLECYGPGYNQCLSCSYPLVLFENSCAIQCPPGFFSDQNIGNCIQCEPSCKTCSITTASTVCLQCHIGIYLYEDHCIKNCPDTYYENIATGKCTQCPQGCFSCFISAQSNTLICQVCQTGKIFNMNGQCVQISTCPTQQMIVIGQVCRFCQSTCQLCILSSDFHEECIQCKAGFSISSSGNCISKCPISTVSVQLLNINNDETSVCQLCPQNCLKCIDQTTDGVNIVTTCQQCKSPYLLNKVDNICQLECQDDYVPEYQPIFQCVYSQNQTEYNISKCQQQGLLMLVDTHKCIEVCPQGYHYQLLPTNNQQICMVCQTGCATCISQTKCLTCTTGFYLLNNINCVASCPTTHLSLNKKCYLCVPPCASCVMSLTYCSSCEAGKFLHEGQCLDSCPNGFYQQSTGCVQCPHKCLTCTSNGVCSACSNINYPTPDCTDINNICQSVQYLYTAAVCNVCNQNCLSCFGPTSYECFSCTSPKILVDSQCRAQCPTGYVQTATQCVLCSNKISNCLQCSENSNNYLCLACQNPYIVSNNVCIQECSSLNTVSTIYSILDGQCVACISGCSVCTLGICLQCSSNKLLQQAVDGSKICVDSCSSGFYEVAYIPSNPKCLICLPECLECINSQSCTQCPVSKFLYQGQCVNSCPIGTYTDYTGTYCINCNNTLSSKCTLCQNTGTTSNIPHCIQCISPYVTAASGSCTECRTGYYYQSSQFKCLACNATCSSCNSLTQCNDCQSGLLLVSGLCVATCPIGTYYDGNLACTDCSIPNCYSCDNNDQCLKCKAGYGFQSGSCASNCQAGALLLNNICQSCPTNCLLCTSLTICTQCQNSLFLYQGSCATTCPAKYTDSNQICVPCKTGCAQCSNAGNTCDICQSGLTNNNDGTCYYGGGGNPGCTSGQYLSNSQCYPCYQTCAECSAGKPSKCLACFSGFLYISGFCIPTCPTHQFYSTSSGSCEDCAAECSQCANSANQCRSCPTGKVLSASKTCEDQCITGTYLSNMVCRNCPSLCDQCQSSTKCLDCSASATIQYNQMCYQSCPISTYSISATECTPCPLYCLTCTSATACQSCKYPYNLYTNPQNSQTTCIANCPIKTYSNQNQCMNCPNNCATCSQVQCYSCVSGLFLKNNACVNSCSLGQYGSSDGICKTCPVSCVNCTSFQNCELCQPNFLFYRVSPTLASCLNSCPTGYIPINEQCYNSNCANCLNCVNGLCLQCSQGLFLQNSACVDICVDTFYGNDVTGSCDPCIADCIRCPDNSTCTLCIDGFNFTIDTGCVSEAYLQFGEFSNMSGFTSNITEITSMIYLTTSAGPVFFGEMSTTYFNIQFCQFLFFHENATAGNQQLTKFLDSLSFLALSSGVSSVSNRRMLFATQSINFIQVNVPIFILMGCFLGVYLLTYLLQKNLENRCLSCPRLKFYVTQICIYMRKRFKWIYFDFVIWLSFLPFLYFALMQIKKFNFNTAIDGVGSILSVVIIIAYPLYPVFICYHIKKNYQQICKQTNTLIEMSLSPWLSKVKRPEDIIMQQDFKYFTKSNFIMIYYPLKYVRKFIFVLVIVLCPIPIVSLGVIAGLNVIFISYMAVFRPRKMPYMVFDFIIQGVLLGFEIFLIIYLSYDIANVNAMSIVAHAVGFVTANLSIVVAIILNLVAYYHIFFCLYTLYKHLKEKIQQKQKQDLKENRSNLYSDSDYIHPNDLIMMQKQMNKNLDLDKNTEDLSDDQRRISNELTDKDLILNNIQPRFKGEITEEQLNDLLMDKDIHQYFKNGQGRYLNNDSLNEGDVKTQNLSDDERDIAKDLTDKDLIINGIQPKYDKIRIAQQRDLFRDKDFNDYYNRKDMKQQNLSDDERDIAKDLTDKDLITNGIQPKYDKIRIAQQQDLFGDKDFNDYYNRKDMKQQNLSEDQRDIAKDLTDKDLIVNGIQPKYDKIRQSQQRDLFGDKDFNDHYNNKNGKVKSKNGEMNDKDLQMNQYRPEMYEDNNYHMGNNREGNLLEDKQLFQHNKKYKEQEDDDSQLPTMKNRKPKKNKKNKNKQSQNKLLDNKSEASDDHLFDSPIKKNNNRTNQLLQNIDNTRNPKSKYIIVDQDDEIYNVNQRHSKIDSNKKKQKNIKQFEADQINVRPSQAGNVLFKERQKKSYDKINQKNYKADNSGEQDSYENIISQNQSNINLMSNRSPGVKLVDTKNNKKNVRMDEQFDEFIEIQEDQNIGQIQTKQRNVKMKNIQQSEENEIQEIDFLTKNRLKKDISGKNVYYKGDDDILEKKGIERNKKAKNNEKGVKASEDISSIDQYERQNKRNQSKTGNYQNQLVEGEFVERDRKNKNLKKNKDNEIDEVNFNKRIPKKNNRKNNFSNNEEIIEEGFMADRDQKNKNMNRDTRQGVDEQIDQGLLVSRKPVNVERPNKKINSQKQIEDLKTKQIQKARKQKQQLRFTRGRAEVINEIDEGLTISVNPNNRHSAIPDKKQNDGKGKKLNQVIYEEAQEPEQLKGKPKQKQQGFFSKIFGSSTQKNIEVDDLKLKKKGKGQNEGFENSNYGSRNEKSKGERNSKKNDSLNVRNDDVDNEDYSDIFRKKRQTVNKPASFLPSTLHLNEDSDFADSGPNSRRQKQSNNEKNQNVGQLIIHQRDDNNSSDEEYGSRSKINRSSVRNKKKKGGLNLNEKSMTFDEQDEIKRKKKQGDAPKGKRRNDKLHIDNKDDEDSEDFENIQL